MREDQNRRLLYEKTYLAKKKLKAEMSGSSKSDWSTAWEYMRRDIRSEWFAIWTPEKLMQDLECERMGCRGGTHYCVLGD